MTKFSDRSIPGIRTSIYGVTPYVAGKFIEDVQSEFGLSSVIKIASNENPYGPYPNSIERMKEEVVRLNQYPDRSFKELRQVLGTIHGASPECISISHGAEGMLQTIGKCFIEDGDEVIIPAVTYTLYREISKIMGARVVDVPMGPSGVSIEAIASALSPRTKLIWLANPNNPTGTIVDKDQFRSLIDRLPSKSWIILDEAYAEFAEPDLLPDRMALIREGAPLIAVRTFSKAYGLAGARLGYALARPEIVTVINTVAEPFNANRVAIAGALAALREDQADVTRAVQQIKADRSRTEKRLRDLGLAVIPSHANFILFETPVSGRFVFEKLFEKGVIVRPCAAWGYDRMIRVTIGTPAQMDRFLTLLESLLKNAEDRV